jgi:hypothetical protein
MFSISQRKLVLSIVALALFAVFGLPQVTWACDEEEPENPENPDTPVNCDPYTTTYNNADEHNISVCVDTYVAINITVNINEECEYRLDDHKCDFCKRFNGCFDPNTDILMGDGSTKTAKDIKEGDLLWNPLAKSSEKVTKLVAGPEELAMVALGYGDKVIRVTQDHPIVVENQIVKASLLSNTENGGTGYTVKQALDLTQDDAVLGSDGQFHKLTALRTLPVKFNQTVINFELEASSNSIQDHAVVANGIVTGDLKTQNAIKEANSF